MSTSKGKREIIGYIPAQPYCGLGRKRDEVFLYMRWYSPYYEYEPSRMKPLLLPSKYYSFNEGETVIKNFTFSVANLSALRGKLRNDRSMVLLAVEGEKRPYEAKTKYHCTDLRVKEILWEPELICSRCGRVRDSCSMYVNLSLTPFCKGCFRRSSSEESTPSWRWDAEGGAYSWEERMSVIGKRFKLPTRKVGLVKLVYPEGYTAYRVNRLKEGLDTL